MDSYINQDLNILSQFIIFIISYLSNVFSSIAGGGAGLIQLPALILFGIPYYKALAVHKIATVALGIGGSIRNYKNLKKNYLIITQLLIFGIPGVILGTFIVTLDCFLKAIAKKVVGLILCAPETSSVSSVNRVILARP